MPKTISYEFITDNNQPTTTAKAATTTP